VPVERNHPVASGGEGADLLLPGLDRAGIGVQQHQRRARAARVRVPEPHTGQHDVTPFGRGKCRVWRAVGEGDYTRFTGKRVRLADRRGLQASSAFREVALWSPMVWLST
jgi:hypothetical protein